MLVTRIEWSKELRQMGCAQVVGLMKWPQKGEWRCRSLKVMVRLPFQSVLGKVVDYGLPREFQRKNPFWTGPGHPGQSYRMHTDAWEAHFPVAVFSSRPNNHNSHLIGFWSLILLWVSSRPSLLIQFQFIAVVVQQLVSVSITFEEWSKLGIPIPPLPWFQREW